jgi:hypothetical protein
MTAHDPERAHDSGTKRQTLSTGTSVATKLLADQQQCWIVGVGHRDKALFPLEFYGLMVFAALDSKTMTPRASA